MGADQPRWYQIGNRQTRLRDGVGCTDHSQTVDRLHVPSPIPIAPTRSAPDCGGAMVARSRILVSGSTATLMGTLTNETGCDVHFSGMPPYAIAFGTDGSEPVLLGDFNLPPREQPPSGDWVIHPGASVPYRSRPVTVQNPDPRWDGTDWCTSSQSTTLDVVTFCATLNDMTCCDRRELPIIQLFADTARLSPDSVGVPLLGPTPADPDECLEQC